MNDHAWNLWLATLPAERRQEYEHLIERITTLLSHDRSYLLDDTQRIERRLDTFRQWLSELRHELDDLRDARAIGGTTTMEHDNDATGRNPRD